MLYFIAHHSGIGRSVYVELTNRQLYEGNSDEVVFTYEDMGPGQIVLVDTTMGQLADIRPE